MLVIFLLPFIVVTLLYLPPLQKGLKNKAIEYASKNYGLIVKVDHFHLGFPLSLELENVYATFSASDTLLAVKSLYLDLGVKQIFRKQLRINDLKLREGQFEFADDSSKMNLRIVLKELDLQGRQVDLKKKQIDVDYIQLKDGEVKLALGGNQSVDTLVSESLPDWVFRIDKIDLAKIDFEMNTPALPFLSAGASKGSIVKGVVSLGQQDVSVDSIDVSGSWCHMELAEEAAEQESVEMAKDSSLKTLWTVQARSLKLANSAFKMQFGAEEKTEMLLSGIGVELSHVFNQGTLVKAKLKDLQAVQQDGIAITSMQADIILDSLETNLKGGYIRTPNSWLNLTAKVDSDVTTIFVEKPLLVSLKGEIGLLDLKPYYQSLPEEISSKKLLVNTAFSMGKQSVNVEKLSLEMPEHFKMTGEGDCVSYQNLEMMQGHFDMQGEFLDVTFAQAFLENKGVQIPKNTNMSLNVRADRGDLGALLKFCAGKGCLSLDATYHLALEEYQMDLSLSTFPLGQFLSSDSLGEIDADFHLTGRAFTWQKAQAELRASIKQLEFKQHTYQHILWNGSLDKTSFKGDFTSRDSSLLVHLIFKGDSVGESYNLSLDGRVDKVDLYALHVVDEPLSVATDFDINAGVGVDDAYSLTLKLDSLNIANIDQDFLLGDLNLGLESILNKTKLNLSSGDLLLKFQADTSLLDFVGNFGSIAPLLQEQISKREVDMEVINDKLSPFRLELMGNQKNVFARFLRYRGIGFQSLKFDATSRKESGLRFCLYANKPSFKTVQLDTMHMGVWQSGKSLAYVFSVASTSGDWGELFNLNLTGKIEKDQFRVELLQKDALGKLRFEIGVNTTLGDSSMAISLFPMNPILASNRWSVNKDNRVLVKKGGKINANLQMAYMNKLIRIQSVADKDDMFDRLKVDIAGLGLSAFGEMLPFLPKLNGQLNTNLLLYSRQENLGVEGDIQVVDLGIDQYRIGTVDLGLGYTLGKNFTDHAIHFELNIDSIRSAVVAGDFSTSGVDRGVSIDMNIPSFPLYIANAFIPADFAKLGGELVGDIHFRGTVDDPLLGGELFFRDGEVDAVLLGTQFKLDTNKIALRRGEVLFDNYHFMAPNHSGMVLNGKIALTPFDKMNMDLTVKADEFELVNVNKNKASLVYGKAYADINAHLLGAFSALNVTGNINLLNRTNITYNLRESDRTVVDKSVDLVRFVSFKDTTSDETYHVHKPVAANDFELRMLVEIGEQVQFGVNLSEDASNKVSIQGGGNLVLSMNTESGMTLSGKYILSRGLVTYSVPIVGKKEFNIQNGSFVEWTGKMMNPLLNIAASEQIKANVDDGEQARQVLFNSIIRIQNNLTHPSLTFDLSAPNDMVVQNQLATFSPEERRREALNLLIYNTYTAPGASTEKGSGNIANNAIYGFVENELNKYTRKAGLTVGLDSRDMDDNTTATDVTYQFSRQLFNDRVSVKVGGRISSEGEEGESNSIQNNLVDDISIEYALTKKRDLYAKAFRYSNYESVLDGEVIRTGVGIVWRKKFRKFKELFWSKRRNDASDKKQ